MVLCEATLRVGDVNAMTTAFDAVYDRNERTEALEWIEHVTTNGMERIRATLRLDDDQLSVSTNSEARMDRVLDALRALDVPTTIIDDSRQPMRDTREAAELAATLPPDKDAVQPLDPSDPQLASVLEKFTRDYEQKWLDESIPALHGFTPRQAAADPTRRGDVIRLIESFPKEHGNPGAMNPDRLRAALGLH